MVRILGTAIVGFFSSGSLAMAVQGEATMETLMHWGIGGAVIFVVVLFLKFMREERNANHQYMADRKAEWLEQVQHLINEGHISHERVTTDYCQALDAHTKVEDAAHQRQIELLTDIREEIKNGSS